MSDAVTTGFGVPWRSVPDVVPTAHLRRMDVREPHLIAVLADGQRLAAQIPDRCRWTVGRDESSDLPIAWDPSVSRLHATLERLGTLVIVEDSGVSRNGTFVGDRRVIGRTRLEDLDELVLGQTTLLLRLPLASAPTSATVAVGSNGAQPTNLELTPAELRVVEVLIAPRDPSAPIPTNREIAAELGVGVETVKSHFKSIARKLAASGLRGPIDRLRLAELAMQGVLGSRSAPPQ